MIIGLVVNELSPYLVCGGVSTWIDNMIAMFQNSSDVSVRIIFYGSTTQEILSEDREIFCITDNFDETPFLDVDVIVMSMWNEYAAQCIYHVREMSTRIPIIYIIHSLNIVEQLMFNPLPAIGQEKVQEKCIRSSDLVVCVSQSERILYERVGYMKLNQNVIVIPNVYLMKEFDVPSIDAYRCNDIGFIGRHIPRKRPEIISHAVYGCTNSEITVYHAGIIEGRQDDSLFRERTRRYTNKIKTIPFTTDQDKLQTEYWDKVGASCATGVYEPFGYTACEALDRYKPLICANVGGFAEITHKIRPGSVFSYDPDTNVQQDTYNIARAIKRFMSTPADIRRDMAIRARVTLHRFAPDRIRPLWLSAFYRMMK